MHQQLTDIGIIRLLSFPMMKGFLYLDMMKRLLSRRE
jgi:hypothetical protein